MRLQCLFISLAATLLCASTLPGSDLKPKQRAEDYRYYAITEHYAIGVNLLTEEEAEARLATPVNGRFFVAEVAIFPRDGRTVKVDEREFTLREPDEKRASLPMDAKEVAGTVHRMATKPKRNVTLYPAVGVSVSRGGTMYPGPVDPNDPMSPNRRNGRGVGSSVGVGVEIENDHQTGGRPEDRDVMERELADYALGKGEFNEPVAGMLFFPMGRMKPVTRKILEYRDPAKPLTAEVLSIDLSPILGP